MTTSTTDSPAAAAQTAGEQSSDIMSVLIADKFQAHGVEALEAAGCRVQHEPDLGADSIPEAMSRIDPDVLIVRGTKVTAAALEAGQNLSLIVRAGAGYDTIDVKTASARGVFIANCPGKNSIAVAELAWALILACDRRVPDQTVELRAGQWNKKTFSEAAGLYGRTIGIVGLGRIGLDVAHRARAFGMKVVAWSRSLTQERADELGIGYCSSLINLAKMADVVSVHVAATADTEKLINDQFCQAMKNGAYFINTSRGSVVDEDALIKVIREKGVRAGLDVYAREPAAADPAFTDPIVQEPGVYGTHHVGACTEQAQNSVADEAVRIIQTYQATGDVPNCVNRATSTTATTLLTVRHLNHPGVLAHVFYTLGQANINVEEMENIIYDGAEAACARIQLGDLPDDSHINTIRANDNVLSVTLARLDS
ncbi:MAG: NAD(P)-dependent oxidoreductase [Planctomycetota bacterium]|jgi:D-3-phosphoglycerate dehydrogenase